MFVRRSTALAVALLSPALTMAAGPTAELQRHMTRAWHQEARSPQPLVRSLGGPRDADSFRPLDAGYEVQSGADKLAAVFDQRIQQTAYKPGRLPSLHKGLLPVAKALLPHLLKKTLTRVGDEFPKAKLKSIHTFGSVAKVEFVAAPDSPYTGMLQGATGVARFSYAGPNIPLLVGNVPGLGLKFFADGRPSENLVVMNKLNSQGKYTSVFQEVFSNILPKPKGPVMNAIRLAFEAVVGKNNGFNQPLDNLASVNPDGSEVTAPRWPYRVNFVPVSKYPFSRTSKRDFRKDLATIPAGFTLYRVMAQDSEASSETREIGSLVTRSGFVASAYGDTKLFFKHNATFLKK